MIHLFRQAVSAGRANLLPGLLLWALALCIIMSYYFVPVMQSFCGGVAAIKIRGGVGLAMVSTGLFGGAIPSIVQQIRPAFRRQQTLRHLPFFTLFWAYKGFEVDWLYKIQAMIFGDNKEFLTVVFKVLVDQFVYVPLLGVTTVVLGYTWKNNHYRFKGYRSALGKGWYLRKVLPLMVANCLIWIPAVSLIYCLPLPLQLPVQNLVLCFFSLVVFFLTGKKES